MEQCGRVASTGQTADCAVWQLCRSIVASECRLRPVRLWWRGCCSVGGWSRRHRGHLPTHSGRPRDVSEAVLSSTTSCAVTVTVVVSAGEIGPFHWDENRSGMSEFQPLFYRCKTNQLLSTAYPYWWIITRSQSLCM